MNIFLIATIIAVISGVVISPFLIALFFAIKNTMERRKIKELLKQNKFLITVDPRDYDSEAWKNKKYGNINLDETKIYLKELNERIFKKTQDNVDDNFIVRSVEYVREARKNNYNDEWIKEEFRKKGYTEDLINKIFETKFL